MQPPKLLHGQAPAPPCCSCTCHRVLVAPAGESSASAHESGLRVTQGWVQAVEMLRQACAVDPAEYEVQTAHNDSAGVRYVAAFITDMAERCCPSYCPWPDLTLGMVMPKSAVCWEGRADWNRMFC